MIEEGAYVFFEDPDDSWVVGHVTKWDGKFGECKAAEGAKVVGKLTEDKITLTREDTVNEEKDDLMDLTLLHDATILRSLRIRYLKDIIYTNIGPIVVALNPFNFKIPWYTDDNMPKYLAEGDRVETQLPHSWAVAHNTYHEMISDAQNQCILVSGESGAGKTEASKIVMKYLACVSTKQAGQAEKEAGLNVGRKINMTSPPLETWGNAKTARNDNSSRFGKFMKVKFDVTGVLTGAYVIKYLLEKSRIISAGPGERCYHSFYLVVRGEDNPRFSLGADSQYKSITSGNCTSNKEFDTAEEYKEVKDALSEIGRSDEDIVSMWKVVAGILHLQNVTFNPDGEGSQVNSATDKDLDNCIAIWGCDKAVLRRELCVSTYNIGGSDVERLLPPVKAADCRDSLSKHLYDNEFSKLIDTCNELLDKDDGGGCWIGLLDIFGFEDFEVNSFEQICINLANESLQHHYNTYIFQRDMDECRAEGIDVTSVIFPDNTPCLQMVCAKGGIMSLLDEECSLGSGSDDGFLSKVMEHHGSNPFFAIKKLSKESFIVKHYAKDVNYTVPGFLEKNRDTLKDAFKLMMRAVDDTFIKGMHSMFFFGEGGCRVQSFTHYHSHTTFHRAPPRTGSGCEGCQGHGWWILQTATEGSYGPHQLHQPSLDSVCPLPLHRHTKPNKLPTQLHQASSCEEATELRRRLYSCTAEQLGCSRNGTAPLHTRAHPPQRPQVRIRKAGFPVRVVHEDFFFKYRVLIPGIANSAGVAQTILDKAGLPKEQAQLGKTKVFMKAEAFLHLEKLKRDALMGSARIVQAWSRALGALSSVRRQILDANKEAMDKMREEVRAEIAEKMRREAEEAAANAEKLAAEKAAKEEAEQAERIRNASAYLQKDEEEGRAAVAAEEEAAWAALMAQAADAHAANLASEQRWVLCLEEERARAAIEREEEEFMFDISSYGMPHTHTHTSSPFSPQVRSCSSTLNSTTSSSRRRLPCKQAARTASARRLPARSAAATRSGRSSNALLFPTPPASTTPPPPSSSPAKRPSCGSASRTRSSQAPTALQAARPSRPGGARRSTRRLSAWCRPARSA